MFHFENRGGNKFIFYTEWLKCLMLTNYDARQSKHWNYGRFWSIILGITYRRFYPPVNSIYLQAFCFSVWLQFKCIINVYLKKLTRERYLIFNATVFGGLKVVLARFKGKECNKNMRCACNLPQVAIGSCNPFQKYIIYIWMWSKLWYIVIASDAINISNCVDFINYILEINKKY